MSIRQNRTSKLEQIKIVSFTTSSDGSVGAEDLVLEIPLNLGEVAKAAMLRGFNEFFYKVAANQGDDCFDPATLGRIETVLGDFARKMGKPRSGLILS